MSGLHWLVCGEGDLPAGEAWLTTVERERLAQIRFTKRRTEFLLRRAVGKRAVAAVLGLEVESSLHRVAMLNHLSGAPFVELDGARADVDISLTDRAGHAVALVGPAGSLTSGGIGVGVDLELVEPRSDGFVTDFLTESEARWVRARGWVDRDANLLWSAKEAALKVLQVGLRADTRSVEVRIADDHRADGWASLVVDHAASGQRFPGWWRVDGEFVLTIVTPRAVEAPQLLSGSRTLAEARPVHSWLASPVHGETAP